MFSYGCGRRCNAEVSVRSHFFKDHADLMGAGIYQKTPRIFDTCLIFDRLDLEGAYVVDAGYRFNQGIKIRFVGLTTKGPAGTVQTTG